MTLSALTVVAGTPTVLAETDADGTTRRFEVFESKEGLVRYQVSKTNGGPSYHEWGGAEFVGRLAALVPPPRKHVVRYYGALGLTVACTFCWTF